LAKDVRQAFVVQGRVLLALILREARTRYGRQKASYLWALIEPIAHITVFYLAFKYRLGVLPLGDNLFAFLASGFAVFLGFRNVMGRVSGAFASNAALLSYPVVRLMDVFLGRALLDLATWLAVLLIIFGGIILSGQGNMPNSVLDMVAAIGALFAIAFGVGLCLGVLSEFLPSIANLIRTPMILLYFISAIFYLPDSMPESVQSVLYWNPIAHGITLFREGYYPGYESRFLDLNYLAGWALGSILLAFVVEKAARKSIRSLPL
jgi:capsular polysaccharide transport system permease protein